MWAIVVWLVLMLIAAVAFFSAQTSHSRSRGVPSLFQFNLGHLLIGSTAIGVSVGMSVRYGTDIVVSQCTITGLLVGLWVSYWGQREPSYQRLWGFTTVGAAFGCTLGTRILEGFANPATDQVKFAVAVGSVVGIWVGGLITGGIMLYRHYRGKRP